MNISMLSRNTQSCTVEWNVHKFEKRKYNTAMKMKYLDTGVFLIKFIQKLQKQNDEVIKSVYKLLYCLI